MDVSAATYWFWLLALIIYLISAGIGVWLVFAMRPLLGAVITASCAVGLYWLYFFFKDEFWFHALAVVYPIAAFSNAAAFLVLASDPPEDSFLSKVLLRLFFVLVSVLWGGSSFLVFAFDLI